MTTRVMFFQQIHLPEAIQYYKCNQLSDKNYLGEQVRLVSVSVYKKVKIQFEPQIKER